MDREKAAERLRKATAEGRLLAEELEQRLETAFSARTYDELDALVADLPQSPRPPMHRRSRELALLRPALALAIAIPLGLVAIAAVVLAVTGVLAVTWVWLALGWWFFGYRKRRFYGPRHVRSLYACGGWRAPRRTRTPASRGYWA